MGTLKIPATYMRGGTSKGVFFNAADLPAAGAARDAVLLRVLGSPDPYGKQMDGMGGGSSSTSKAVILSKSTRANHDVDYWFAQVSVGAALVDWSGNCGNLSAAVGAFAIHVGLMDAPADGVCSVRIWQANIGKTIVAHVPMCGGLVQEAGDFELDGVTFPSAEVVLEFISPAAEGALFPTGRLVDELDVPQVGCLPATLINAGIPTVFVNATDVGCTGVELQDTVNGDAALLAKFELIRAHAALKMGFIAHLDEAKTRQHTPKIAFVAPPADYVAASGKPVAAGEIDVLVRALSMGQLHHAMMGTAAVAIGTAAAIEGTLVSRAAGGAREGVRFGHPSGTLRVGAQAACAAGEWVVSKAVMSRSARVLMSGWVHVPSGVI
ncbi:MAG: 2-methylaconitate cis-trans isomerase PrpF [Formosimonas sp.]